MKSKIVQELEKNPVWNASRHGYVYDFKKTGGKNFEIIQRLNYGSKTPIIVRSKYFFLGQKTLQEQVEFVVCMKEKMFEEYSVSPCIAYEEDEHFTRFLDVSSEKKFEAALLSILDLDFDFAEPLKPNLESIPVLPDNFVDLHPNEQVGLVMNISRITNVNIGKQNKYEAQKHEYDLFEAYKSSGDVSILWELINEGLWKWKINFVYHGGEIL